MDIKTIETNKEIISDGITPDHRILVGKKEKYVVVTDRGNVTIVVMELI